MILNNSVVAKKVKGKKSIDEVMADVVHGKEAHSASTGKEKGKVTKKAVKKVSKTFLKINLTTQLKYMIL